MKKLTFFILGFLLSLQLSFAQGILKGKVVNAENEEPLIGATVAVKGSTTGTATALDGSFTLEVAPGEKTLVVTYVGFVKKEMNLTVEDGTEQDLDLIRLKPDAIGLEEVKVVASIAQSRETPVAASNVQAKKIQMELGNQEFPQIMNTTPGVYATKKGGGSGDSRINIRGFDQRNVAVLINGVPVNDMENGWVYWSNWAGLSDATRTIQVQRGLGASKLAISSVGGTINIITKTTDAEEGGFAETSVTDYGNRKFKLGYSTGVMDNGYALSFVGSRTEGSGYVDGTWVDAWSYFLSVSKDFNNHKLSFTAIGAPQKHGQRDEGPYDSYTHETIDRYGVKYNKDWGYLDGEMVNEDMNYYHKPQFALNHYWDMSESSMLATSAYLSFGRGGGSGPLGRGDHTGYWKYNAKVNATGQYDYNYMRELNRSIESPYYINSDGNRVAFDSGSGLVHTDSTVYKGARYILRNSVNHHFWSGVLSSFYHDFSDDLKLTAGVDLRLYKGEHYRKVRNLLGADYWNDENAMKPEAGVGDIIDYHNDGIVDYGGGFAQLEYSNDIFSAFLAGSASNTWYKRIDYMSYLPETDKKVSDWESQFGYNVKTGANYNLTNRHNVFFNAGYYARAPFFDFVFINYTNEVNPDYTSEKITGLELGYGYQSTNISFDLNGYYTLWSDRWNDTYYPAAGRTIYFKGLEELHTGIDAELSFNISEYLKLETFGSLGDWHYTNDVEVDVYDEADQTLLGTYQAYTKDLKVPDAPQTTFGASADFQLFDPLNIGLTYKFYDQLYANFDPLSRTDPEDDEQSYMLPSYDVVDARATLNFDFLGLDAQANAIVHNLFNNEYIAEGDDLGGHNKDSFVGMWGWKRNFYFSLRVNF